jgi:Mg2+ and Co2+ transporter CorA
MNVHFPGFGTAHAFWVIVAAMVVTITGMVWFFHSKRWL